MEKEELDVLKQRLRKRIELPYPANIAEAVNLSNELQTVIKALEQAYAEKEEINKAYHDMNHQVHKLTYEKMELQAEIERLKYDKSPIEENLLPLQAENKRYRQALEELSNLSGNNVGELLFKISKIVRQTLEGSE